MLEPAHHRIPTGHPQGRGHDRYLTPPDSPVEASDEARTKNPVSQTPSDEEISTTWVLRDRLEPRMFEGKRPESSGNTATR